MMAKKIIAEQVEEMIHLYDELGSYSAVAKRVGISAATVSRYIKEQASIKTYSTCVTAKPISEISKESLITFSHLTDEEKQSYNKWIKEFGI